MSKGPKPQLLDGKSKEVVRVNAFRLLKWGLTPKESVHRALVHAGYRKMPVERLPPSTDKGSSNDTKPE